MCRRTCTASPTTRTRTGRARSRAATRSGVTSRRSSSARASATDSGCTRGPVRGVGCRGSRLAHRDGANARHDRGGGSRARVRAAHRARDPRDPRARDLPRSAVPLVAVGPRRRARRSPGRGRGHRGERGAGAPRARTHRGPGDALPAHARLDRAPRRRALHRRGSRRFAAHPDELARLRAALYAEGEARFASRSGDAAAASAAREIALAISRRRSPAPGCAPRSPPTTRSDASGCCSRTTSTPRSRAGGDARGLRTRGGRGTDVTAVGGTHEVDALVLATGFASTRQPYADLVSGESGHTRRSTGRWG